MYSGYNLIYGFKIDIVMLRVIMRAHNGHELDSDCEYEDEFFSDINCDLVEIHKLPCCYGNSDRYVGILLGGTHMQYRENVLSFNTFNEYDKNYRRQLDKIKKEFEENEAEINKQFEKLYRFNDIFKNPKFYTLPNDCESCT
jgi:hypothetical protein